MRKAGPIVEKRRVRLEINGVVCGLITQETDEYMDSLSKDVGELMREIQSASPYITREAAALTVALSFCDDARKNGAKAVKLQERVDELEVEAEIWQEEKAEQEKKQAEPSAAAPDPALLERIEALERENTALSASAGQLEELRRLKEELQDENETLRQALQKQEAAARQAAQPEAVPAKPDAARKKRRENPLRSTGIDDAHMVSFFAK